MAGSNSPLERRIIDAGPARIEYFAQGGGPLVILLPSLGRGAADFDAVRPRLAGSCRVVTPEPRGIGASTGPLSAITLHDFARDVAAVIEHESGGPALIGGHAFGNFVARTTATDRPDLVRGVALLGATHVWPVPADVRESIMTSSDLSLPREARLAALRHAFFAPASDASVWLTGWHPETKKAQRVATDATPQAEWWQAGNVPILDVQPENDVMIPSEAISRYRDDLGERVSIVRIPNAGHALLPEQPEAVAQALLDFVRKLFPTP
ncbi:MAG TPA: alpha/beta hydrolase [Burkholderiales bacterium]|nr:alpha/beta hydrolase [Burkholderiales bacterium]